MCQLTAEVLGINAEEVIVASTGVIGQVLPIEPIEKAVKPLADTLSYTGNEAAATAIMTTDTVKKEVAVEFMAGGKLCKLGLSNAYALSEILDFFTYCHSIFAPFVVLSLQL